MTRTHADRTGLEILTPAQCLHLLRSAPYGRLAFTSPHGLMVLPVNHVMHGFTIAFRTAPGSKMDAAIESSQAAFQIDGVDADHRTGWSVLAIGTVKRANEIDRRQLAMVDHEPWADSAPRDHWLVVDAERMSGRRIRRPSSRLADPGPSAMSHGATFTEQAGLLAIQCNCGWAGTPVNPGDRSAIGDAHTEYRAHVQSAPS